MKYLKKTTLVCMPDSILDLFKACQMIVFIIVLSSCGGGGTTEDIFEDDDLNPENDYVVLEYGYGGVPEQIDGFDVITTADGSVLEGDIEFPASAPISFCEDNSQDGISSSCQPLTAIDASRYAGSLWPRGIVPFTFADTLPSTQRTAFNAAMDLISSVSNITFVQRSTESDYIEIILFEDRPFQGRSALGRQGGKQIIRLGARTGYGLAMHEIFHALGVFHEQSRTDRDRYVNLFERNIRSDMISNYRKATETESLGAYDFLSIMHYANGTFSSCADGSVPDPGCPMPQPEVCPDGVSSTGTNGRCPTMDPLELPEGQSVTCSIAALGSRCPGGTRFVSGRLGQMIGLTDGDIDGINVLYPEIIPLQSAVNHPNGKAYFIKSDQYLRFDFNPDRVDRLATIGVDGWWGLWASGIDAAVNHPNGKAYFFKDDKYRRYGFSVDRVEKEGTIDMDGWRGLWAAGIDASVNHPNGKAYFFKGDRYQRFDFSSDQVDKEGIIGVDGWRGVWTSGIDAAVNHPNGKAYFFKGDKYQRFDFGSDQVDKEGYLSIDGWKGL